MSHPQQQQMNEELARRAALQVREELHLKYVPVFVFGKAAQVIWATLCFLVTLIFYGSAESNLSIHVIGSVSAVLFVMALVGTPIRMHLDAPSRRRFEMWLESQRDTD
jgi:precorrin-3B methylase